jgi:hypothetical protein
MRGPLNWGSLTLDGQFALVDDGGPVFLERCGTRMRWPTSDPDDESYDVSANSGAVVWQEDARQLNGLFLPSLQTFTIPLPSAIVRPPGATENSGARFVLTSDTLYVIDGWYGRLWRTASPTALPVNTSRPSVSQSGTTVTCKRGRWRDAHRFSYAWHVNGVRPKDASHTLAISNTGRLYRVSCSVTASNADGTTTATSAPLRVR